MSRAFVRESDDSPDLPLVRPISSLPAGAKNYLTSQGAERLREELRELVQSKRPKLLASTDDPETKRNLLLIEQRIQQIERSLETAEVVAGTPGPADVVRFGATVTVRTGEGEVSRYRIVGIDEIDLDQGHISWQSPIAKAMINARVGARVPFQFPSGKTELEIMAIDYE